MNKSKLNIWYITDQKPGHLNQLRGLSARLQAHTEQSDLSLHENWLIASQYDVSWNDYVLKRNPSTAKQPPDVIIGAGHHTHKQVLVAGRRYSSFTVILMRPSIPLLLFDAAIIPEHDNPPRRTNVLATKGVLNTIVPQTKSLTSVSDHGLILVGGESLHYHWNDEKVVEQILQIAQQNPKKQWTLTNSRRTPLSFEQQLLSQMPGNVSFTPHTQTHPHWVSEQMQQCSEIWVTPDSVSMVYEAITSGIPSGLFDLEPSKPNRINRGIQHLLDSGLINSFSHWRFDHTLTPPDNQLWEADRAARWLLELIKKVRYK